MDKDIRIFEDQTGYMLFPEKRIEKDSNAVKLFGNQIDLYINKMGNKLEISCYLLIRKGLDRAIGSYIIYKDNYTDFIFSDFKNYANKALREIGFEPHSNDTENAIFNNIEKFNSGNYNKDIDIISKALKSGECLYYKAGNIIEISSFCNIIMRNFDRIKIAISTGESNLGEINISRDKIHEDSLTPTDKTKQILDKQKEKILQQQSDDKKKLEEEKNKADEERKRKEGDLWFKKIKDGAILIKDGTLKLRSLGFKEEEIEYELKRIKSQVYGELPSGKEEKEEKEKKEKKEKIFSLDIILLGIAIFMLGLIIGTMVLNPYILSKKDTGSETTPIPTITEIPSSPTPTIIMTSTPSPTPTATETIPSIEQYGGCSFSTDPTYKCITIKNYDPKSSPITNTNKSNRTFSITLERSADVTWYVNDVIVQSNKSVIIATYTNVSTSKGNRSIKANVSTPNGGTIISWDWIVK